MYVYCRDKAKTQKVKHGQAILENYSILTNKQNAKSSNNRWCNIHTHHFPQGLGPCWHPIHAHRFHWLRHSSAQARFHFCLLQGLEKTALQADWAGQNCQHWNGIQDLYIYIYIFLHFPTTVRRTFGHPHSMMNRHNTRERSLECILYALWIPHVKVPDHSGTVISNFWHCPELDPVQIFKKNDLQVSRTPTSLKRLLPNAWSRE